MGLVVFKLGGSLLSCVDLPARLSAVFRQRPDDRLLIVVGGGAAADVVRDWNRLHTLPDEAAHWLAIRSLSLNRALVRHLLPESREVSSREAAESLWSNAPLKSRGMGFQPVNFIKESPAGNPCHDDFQKAAKVHRPLLLDVEACLRATEPTERDPLPHCWDVTSDSIAARIAARWDADELVLLKSTGLPAELTLDDATRLDLIDPYFRHLANETPRVSWCNLRDEAASIVPWLGPSPLQH